MEQRIILGDCLNIMKNEKSSSVDLVFADPPFNIGIKYDLYKDNLSYNDYKLWSKSWIMECYRLLKSNGSIYIAIGDEFVSEINIILKELGFYFRNWIIWYYSFGQNQRKKFSRTHTHILYFTKDKEDFTFNDKDIRIPSKRQTIYNDKRANSIGKIPDDVWNFSRVCGTFKERLDNHPCQMPENILERIIKTSSNIGDFILDPFGGTGTTAKVAKSLNRNSITIEISEKYYNTILERLNSKLIYIEKIKEKSLFD